MNSDDDNHSSSSISDSSDPDLATVLLTQLLRSGRAHILSERNLRLHDREFNDFVAPPMPPPSEAKPDITTLEGTDIHMATSISAGLLECGTKKIPQLIYERQIGCRRGGRFSQGDRSFIGHHYLPNEFSEVANCNHKMFCGTYSKDGNIFLSASQDRVIRVYDTTKDKFKNPIEVQAQDVGWAILDTAFSPSGRHVIYSSWSEAVHMCDLSGDLERHEVLPLCPDVRRFCVFSITFSHDGQEILGGANDGCLYVYDLESQRRTLRIPSHDDDVNAVTYADETSQIFFSGADDGLCKVWDRRTLVESSARPVGIFAGHVDGLTYVDSRGDGRHLVTNSKDQSIKLWDLRKFSGNDAQENTRKVVRTQNWDYRWQNVPWRLAGRSNQVAGDTSLMTYKGHSVLQTLIRCHFSPQFSTGQRYIYTGCAAGRVVIYDVLTGRRESVLLGHTACVRDVSWHPYKTEIVDTAWDGRHYKWFYVSPDESELQLDSSDCADSDDSADEISWMAQQRMDQRYGSFPNSRTRRSSRLAAQQRSQPSNVQLRRSSRLSRPPP